MITILNDAHVMVWLAWLKRLEAQMWTLDGFDSHVTDWLAQLPKNREQEQYEDASAVFDETDKLLEQRERFDSNKKSYAPVDFEAADRLIAKLDEKVGMLYQSIGLGPDGKTPSAPLVAVGASDSVKRNRAGPKVGKDSVDATRRETQQAASSPKFSMRLNALIEAHIHEWPTIKTDIKAASDNGLFAAKAGARGWWEELTMGWARANGKLISAAKPTDSLAQAMHNMGRLPSRTNRLKG